VQGKLSPNNSYCDIQLTTDEGYGLTGFRTPPDPEFLKKNTGEQGAVANP